MHKNDNPVPCRFHLFRTLAVAALFGLVSVGQAAAEGNPEPETRVVAAPAGEPGVESASQRGRERAAPRFDRRPANQERRARRSVRRDGHTGRAGHWFGRRMAAALDLTEEQRDQMREAMREMGDHRRENRRQIADARRSFQRAARNPEVSADEIQTLGEALGRAQAELVLQRRSERERVAGILTEEQIQQLEQMRERGGQRSPRGRRRG